jgi:hypothetical protein
MPVWLLVPPRAARPESFDRGERGLGHRPAPQLYRFRRKEAAQCQTLSLPAT